MKRVFLIVLDSFGMGELPDAAKYGDCGANTLASVALNKNFNASNLKKLGLFNIEGVSEKLSGFKCKNPMGSFVRLGELSPGKDTTTGHFEMAGMISKRPFPTYPNGFPKEVIEEFEQKTGRKVLCNKPYSGTQVIHDYGQEHIKTGALIVYTSADSVFQIAAHKSVVPLEELYEDCKIARKMLVGEHGVGRVIARPFEGEYPNFKRTSERHDFALAPEKDTMLDVLSKNGYETIGVGKIRDIFAGKGVNKYVFNKSNADGMNHTLDFEKQDFEGLCFVNLVDFDMLYGHRNDTDGYAKAISEFDAFLPKFMENMKKDDVLMITADHGCDPEMKQSTDHSREYVPCIVYGENIKQGVNLGTRKSFSDIAATICEYFNVKGDIDGESFLKEILK